MSIPDCVHENTPVQKANSSIGVPSLSSESSSDKNISGNKNSKPGLINPENPSNIFHKFSFLPAELRLMVWKWASFRPRIVHVLMVDFIGYETKHQARDAEEGDEDARAYCEREFVSNNAGPAVLHACHESRTEALKWYTLDITGYWRTPEHSTIYFNHAVDTMYLEVKNAGQMLWPIKLLCNESNPDGCLPEKCDSNELPLEETTRQQNDTAYIEDTAEERVEEDVEKGAENDPFLDSPVGNRSGNIKRLAVNLDAVYEDLMFEGSKSSENLQHLPYLKNLLELTVFYAPDSSVWEETGDLVSTELEEELELPVKGKERTNAKSLAILDKVVRRRYLRYSKRLGTKAKAPSPPTVSIMQVSRLPRAW